MRPFACDMILIEDRKILLVKRGREPEKGKWVLPGGRIDEDETAEKCLLREMKEETGLVVEPTKLVGIYSDPKRDPRKIIAAAYIVEKVSGRLKAGDDAADAKWFSLRNMPELGFDHKKIVADALKIILFQA